MIIHALRIEETPPLFEDFLKKSDSLLPFFPHLKDLNWEAVLRARKSLPVSRTQLKEILQKQHHHWGAPASSLEKVALLGDSNTVAVVAGQQAGVFGGPLYTFYKTLTVIRLCRELAARFPEYTFVPVFWLEVNDSDFREIAQLRYLSKEGQVKQLQLSEPPEEVGRPIAARRIDPALQSWCSAFEEDFFDSEFKADLLNDFFSIYSPEHTYGDAFARLLFKFFARYGLVVVDPSDPALLSLAEPLFRQAVQAAPEIRRRCDERSAALTRAGYTPQIRFQPKQSLLFYLDRDGRRYRLDMRPEGGFVYKAGPDPQLLPENELLSELAERPGALSPNVALRPLLQDFLLPACAYVAGPSEVAYFAQLGGVYEYFEIAMPVVYPRHRITLSEPKLQRNLRKLDLSYDEIFRHKTNLVSTYLKKNAAQQLFQATEQAQQTIQGELERMRTLLEQVDPTLLATLQKTRQNVESSFAKLSHKIQKTIEAKHETQVRQLESILTQMFPEGNYQERVLNLLGFAIKFGPDFLHDLLEYLPVDVERHCVAEL